MPNVRSRFLSLALAGAAAFSGCGRPEHAGFAPDVRRELESGRQAVGRWLAEERSGVVADEAVIGLGYAERLRLGLGSPFRLVESALRDPRLSETCAAGGVGAAVAHADGRGVRGGSHRAGPRRCRPVWRTGRARPASSEDHRERHHRVAGSAGRRAGGAAGVPADGDGGQRAGAGAAVRGAGRGAGPRPRAGAGDVARLLRSAEARRAIRCGPSRVGGRSGGSGWRRRPWRRCRSPWSGRRWSWRRSWRSRCACWAAPGDLAAARAPRRM
jgi:hypothetical protein